ncbi:glycosyltransferase family 2 protein [Georgenia subflava]|uniref:Glycosyltransferase n=1 Tax=Georgenia subflava TaxID=1622177 RepID=A0A6N7ENS5_9MICO|nr:glycosyltransferase family 2 protein [Georgenia subflava]MPV38768.1 glycosyltransferase [Georgenia subflava]
MVAVQAPHGLVAQDLVEPQVTVLTVTYNSRDVIAPLLQALPAALEGVDGIRVVIVDNNSADDTVALARRLAPWATIVEPGHNGGYSAGINAGLAGARPVRAALILNPDTVPDAGMLRRLLDAVTADRDIGIAVPVLRRPDGALHFSLRREPTLLRSLGTAVLGGPRASRFALLGEEIRDVGPYLQGTTADWATGAAFLITRTTMETIGDWDEKFFLYSEETDYALRARDAGLRLELVPTAGVTHHGGDLAVSSRLWSLMTVNRMRLYRKRHATIPSVFYWMLLIFQEGLRTLIGRRRSRAALRVLLRSGIPTRRHGQRLNV